jgi:hypothetical protein
MKKYLILILYIKNMKMKTFIDWLKFLKKDKWECYEIHTIQARMYGCNSQCKECREEQLKKK